MSKQTFIIKVSLNVYDHKERKGLGTQAGVGRYLQKGKTEEREEKEWLEVTLCEDGYRGWLRKGDFIDKALEPKAFRPGPQCGRADIEKAIPSVLAFAFEAMQAPNRYLWGGTLGPNFDCSGLVQAAFASQGIWVPRDAKEQAAGGKDSCTESIADDQIKAGDLLFFSRTEDIDHVGISLGNGFYIHSSGVEFGRDGIGIDQLSEKARGAGANYSPIYCYSRRVCSSLVPKIHL